MPKQEWQRPKVLSVNSLPDTFGDCLGGSTDIIPNGDVGSCINGQNTGTTNHVCNVGGIGMTNGVACSTGGQYDTPAP